MARPIEKRDHIEREVVGVIAAKGLAGTTIQDIARAASVSPGLLYRYWENRDSLAAEVYRKHLSALLKQLNDAGGNETNPMDRLSAMVKAFLQFADNESLILKFLLLAQHELAPLIPQEAGVRSFLQDLVNEGVRKGHFRPMDPDLVMQFAIGIVIQPVVGMIYGDLTPPVSDYYEDIMGALRRALLPSNN